MPITVISELPTFTSLEEHAVHQQSTPSSFTIPPVLRRKEADVTLQLTPTIDGFSEGSEALQGDLYISEGLVDYMEAKIAFELTILLFAQIFMLLFAQS